MKTVRILCFSLTGLTTAERLAEGLRENVPSVEVYGKSKYLPDSFSGSTLQWAGTFWDNTDSLIFVGASGIAVRSIAPFVASKKTDPAILVIDECGNHVISLLSGHLGGANELAGLCARLLNADPVITTATDLHDRFAVDVFAKKNLCGIRNMKAAKEVSAAVLAGEPVGFFSEFPYEGKLPEGLVEVKEGDSMPKIGVAVTIHRHCSPFAETVQILPRIVSLGMGCKKQKDFEPIRFLADQVMEKQDLFRETLEVLASIDLKKEEPGLLTLAEEWKLPFHTYSSQELLEAPGEYAASNFVRSITGVDNVCERSAVLASDGGTVLQHKVANDGVTAALAIRNWRIKF